MQKKLPNVGDLIEMQYFSQSGTIAWTIFYVEKRIRIKNKILGRCRAFYYYHLRSENRYHYESRTSEDIQMLMQTKQWKVRFKKRCCQPKEI